jgi:protein-L-isoaspartate O-methyltransferase
MSSKNEIDGSSCPVCGAHSNFAKKINTATVFLCTQCKMVHAVGDIQISSENVVDTDPDYFSGTMNAYELQCEVANQIVPRRLEAYAKILGRPVRKILEVGPGSGAYAKAYVDQGIEYLGIEIETKIAEQTRQRTGLNIRDGDFATYRDLDSNYDVVFASQVFEHILQPRQFLGRVKQVANRGMLHIDVPNQNSLVSQVRRLLSSSEYGFIQPPYHMLAYTVESLENLLRREGFKISMVSPYCNDHKIWGQLIYRNSFATKAVYRVSQLTNSGSLLTAVALI